MSEDQLKVVKSTSVVSFFTLLSRVTGMLRDMVVASVFRAGVVADAFFVAYSIPNMLRRLVGEGSLTMSFIPVFSDYLEQKGKDEAVKLANVVFSVLFCGLIVLVGFGILISPFLVRIMAPGFEKEPGKLELAILLTQEVFPYIFLISLVAFAMGILNSFRHFGAPAFSQVLLNLTSVFMVWFFAKSLEPKQPGIVLVLGVIVGGVLQLAIQVPFLIRYGFRFRFSFDIFHPGLKAIGKLFLASLFGVAVYQINVLINTIFVSPFSGGRSYIYYADRLVEFPMGIFAIALGTAILPEFSEKASKGRLDELSESLGFGLRFLAFFILPTMLGFILLGFPIVSIIYEHGDFLREDSLSTTRALVFYSIGLWASAGLRILVPAFYSLKDARTPVWAGVASMLVNLIGCYLFTMPSFGLGFSGVALSTSIGSIVNFLILLGFIRTKLPSFGGRKTLIGLLKSVICCVVMLSVLVPAMNLRVWEQTGQILQKLFWLTMVISGCAGVYFFCGFILRMEEVNMFFRAFKGFKLRKR